VFTLDGHPHGRDGDYLLVSVEWSVGWPVEDHREGAAPTWQPFSARFRAIPSATPFRPQRRTPWPRIHGVLPAHVDGPASSTLADIDAEGRYRVVLPFVSSSSNGQAVSRRMRLAQSLAGAGHGSHAPLRRGAEVLVAHLGGDPDRPVIVGAVPNAVSPSPVTSTNASHTVHRSASGVLLDLDDQEGGIGS
jgi:type VI secretion system secreted protein VgrG